MNYRDGEPEGDVCCRLFLVGLMVASNKQTAGSPTRARDFLRYK